MPELATTLTSTEDERLEQAEGVVRAFCGWHIGPERTDTETQTVAGCVALLPTLHVVGVVSVTLADGTVLDSDSYAWSTSGMVQLLRPTWWDHTVEPWSAAHRQTITVEYTHGYTPPPAEVVGVVRAIAQRATDNPHGVTQQTTGPFSISYPNPAPLSLLDAERVVLGRYRLNPRL